MVFFAVAAWLGAPASTPPAVPTGTPLAGQEAIGTDSLVTVAYRVDGAATSADLTHTDGSGIIQQQPGVVVSVVRSSDGSHGLRIPSPHGVLVSLSAQNTGDSGYLHCSIEADGVVINQGDASGRTALLLAFLAGTGSRSLLIAARQSGRRVQFPTSGNRDLAPS